MHLLYYRISIYQFYIKAIIHTARKLLGSEHVRINAGPRAELALLKSCSDSPELGPYPDMPFTKGFLLIVCLIAFIQNKKSCSITK